MISLELKVSVIGSQLLVSLARDGQDGNGLQLENV